MVCRGGQQEIMQVDTHPLPLFLKGMRGNMKDWMLMRRRGRRRRRGGQKKGFHSCVLIIYDNI